MSDTPTQSVALQQGAGVTTNTMLAPFSGMQAFEDAQRVAKCLSQSSMVPKDYQNNIPNVLIAMECANRIGTSVLAVMQAMVPIHGKPSWSAAFLIATVNTCGKFTPLKFEWSGTEGQPTWGCRAHAKDKATGESLRGTLITIAMARSEGWTSKAGSKWATMPEQMLMYRAAAFWQRVYAPELSFGMHTADEVRDGMIDVDEVIPVTPATASTLAASEPSAQAAPAPAPAPAQDAAAATASTPRRRRTQEPAATKPAEIVVEPAPVVPAAEPTPIPTAPVEQPAPEPAPVVVTPPPAPASPVEVVEKLLTDGKVAWDDFTQWLETTGLFEKARQMRDIQDLPNPIAATLIADNNRHIRKCVTLYGA